MKLRGEMPGWMKYGYGILVFGSHPAPGGRGQAGWEPE